MRMFGGVALATLGGAATLALSLSSVSALTLSGPSLAPPLSAEHIDKVWYDRWGNWHPGPYYGYGPLGIVGAAAGAVLGGAAAVGGAIVGAPGPCWHQYYNHYEGWHWRRVC